MNPGIARTFASLRVPNYRRFFAGQVVSWTGTWVQWVAQAWLVLELTGSGIGLGIITALQWLPVLVLGAWAGSIADRSDKRRLLIGTNISAAVLSLTLGLATLTGIVNLGFVIVIALLLGVVTAIDNPARQTFTMEMVGRPNLTNAVSLNTATFTTARVLGPAAAGFLIEGVGIAECFIVNAASFIPVTIALLSMDTRALFPSDRVARARGQVREGMRYAASVPILRTLLTIMAVVGTLQYNFQVILPLLAQRTFEGGPRVLGLLGAALGIGMFMGSLGNAAFGRSSKSSLLLAGFSLGGMTLLLAAAPNLPMAVVLMVPLGAASMAFLATINSTLQLTSADSMRGRVMALYFVLFLGSTPIGAPIVGWTAEAIDPRAALVLGGLGTVSACLFGWRRLPPLHETDRGAGDPASRDPSADTPVGSP